MKKYVLLLSVAVVALIGGKALALSLPAGTGLFETSLQNRITFSDSSMTLTSTSTRGGGVLPAGYNCFTLDEGLSNAEWVCGTLTSAKTLTGLTRGIDPNTGTSTNASLQFGHRVGADVKITDFPLIQMLKALLNAEEAIPNLLKYADGTGCSVTSSNGQICDKAYVDGVAVAGASNANETTKGIVELATQIEMASSSATGSTGAALALQAKYASSSPTSVCGLCITVSQNNGKLTQAWFDLSQQWQFYSSASTTIAKGFYANQIAAPIFIATSSTATSTFAGGILMKNASTTNFEVGGICTNCATNGYEQSTNTGAGPTVATNGVTVDATCTGAKRVIGGGGSDTINAGTMILQNSGPTAANVWEVKYYCAAGSGGCAANTITAYAICVNP